ncbi:MAG: flagellar hook-basal body complex protein FliE [Acidobacteria bacterium]|nr:flagellar hook-basal body complex protein FliE [Acidobacteriota bacterium]
MDPLSSIRFPNPVEPLDTVSLSPEAGKKAEASFGNLFEQAVARVEQAHQDGQQKIGSLLRGEEQELHEVVLATQRADLSFDYFLQVRNKFVQAYQEIMRMQM